HHLVRTFGYEPGMIPSSVSMDLGVPILTNPTFDASDAEYRPRKKVDQVYSLIINDLNKAINLLSSGDAGSPKYITLSGAQALMARIQLYAGNYENADEFATKALNNTSATLSSPGGVATIFDETA